MSDFSMDGNRVWSESFKVTKNKSLEFQVGRFREGDVLTINLSWTKGQDHAGIGLRLEILGCHLIVNFHDNRHWNWKKGRWYDEGEEIKDSQERTASRQQEGQGGSPKGEADGGAEKGATASA